MKVRKIDTDNRKDVNRFIKFSYDLYRDDPLWVPPILSEMRNNMNKRKYPFFKHSEAEFLVVESDGQVLGRVAIMNNKNFNAYHQSKKGFFYYFDVIQDSNVARAIFDAAADWCRGQGLDTIIGPKGFTRLQSYGMLVKGFEYDPGFDVPYNPPYYERMFVDYGFEKDDDMLTGWRERSGGGLSDKLKTAAERVKERGGFTIKSFKSKWEIYNWAERISKVHDDAFAEGNPNYFPLTKAEAEGIARSFALVANPALIKVVLKDDEPAGFILTLVDVGDVIRKHRGRLFPFGWIDLLREINNPKRVLFNGVGMLPKYQGRGGNILLYAELEKTLFSMPNLTHGQFLYINENNFKSKSDHDNLEVNWNKVHRMYHLAL
jgi:hypothetical protein